jgi:hypothetical protein
MRVTTNPRGLIHSFLGASNFDGLKAAGLPLLFSHSAHSIIIILIIVIVVVVVIIVVVLFAR